MQLQPLMLTPFHRHLTTDSSGSATYLSTNAELVALLVCPVLQCWPEWLYPVQLPGNIHGWRYGGAKLILELLVLVGWGVPCRFCKA